MHLSSTLLSPLTQGSKFCPGIYFPVKNSTACTKFKQLQKHLEMFRKKPNVTRTSDCNHSIYKYHYMITNKPQDLQTNVHTIVVFYFQGSHMSQLKNTIRLKLTNTLSTEILLHVKCN